MPHQLQLSNLVQQLKLFGMSDSLNCRLRQARDKTMSYEELLLMLLQDEVDSREQQSLQRRITQAKFEEIKTFEAFDIKRYSLKVRHAINDLMTGKFIKEKNHVIIMGPVGTGKTHLSQALGMLACERRYKIKFVRSNELLLEFRRSRADNSYDALLKRYRTRLKVAVLSRHLWASHKLIKPQVLFQQRIQGLFLKSKTTLLRQICRVFWKSFTLRKDSQKTPPNQWTR